MPTVFTIGETIYDIIFENGQPKIARAGGAMLNTAVSLGRCGLTVEMITELGHDRVGVTVLDSLKDNGISTTFAQLTDGFRTPVSLAFLDERGEAQYSFYRCYPADRLMMPWPGAVKGDVALFGSFYSLDPAIHDRIAIFVRSVKQSGGLVIYDPNIRKNHLQEVKNLMPFVEENISLSDIVRGSDEDFENLFGVGDPEQVYDRLVSLGCKHLIYTRSGSGAYLLSNKIRRHFPAKKIKVVSTIGAGDSFNAGIIIGLVKKGLTVTDRNEISAEDWEEVIGYGICFSAEVCESYENHISREYAAIIRG